MFILAIKGTYCSLDQLKPSQSICMLFHSMKMTFDTAQKDWNLHNLNIYYDIFLYKHVFNENKFGLISY